MVNISGFVYGSISQVPQRNNKYHMLMKRKRDNQKQTLFVTLRYNNSLQKYMHPSINEINLRNLDRYKLGRTGESEDHGVSKRRRLRNFDKDDTSYEENLLSGFDSKDEEKLLDLKLKREIENSKHDAIANTRKLKKLNFELSNTDLRFFEFLDSYKNQHTQKIASQNKVFVSGTEYENLGMSGYICGYCFRCFQDQFQYTYHTQIKESCESRMTSKDDIIYDDQNGIMIKQLDGLTNSHTLQRLSSLSKLFIPHKLNNASDIIKFEFFLLYINNEFVGYFSKEKNTTLWNLSCILIVKKSGLSFKNIKRFEFGQFLIYFSYQLSLLDESFLGSPEKPFSDFGLLAYRKYFKFRLVKFFLDDMEYENQHFEIAEFLIDDISKITGMVKNDIVFGFESLGVFQYSKELKKIKIDFDLLTNIKSTKEYNQWIDTINQFDKQHFKDFIRNRFKKELDKDKVRRLSKNTLSYWNNKKPYEWIDVKHITKITLFKTLSDADHGKYLDSFK